MRPAKLKITALFLALIMALALAACTNVNNDPGDNKSPPSTSSEEYEENNSEGSSTNMQNNNEMQTPDNNDAVSSTAPESDPEDTGDPADKAMSTPKPVAVEIVKLDFNEKTMHRNDSLTLAPTILPVDATDRSLTYKTDDQNVVTVSADGKIYAAGAGTATITCTASSGVQTICKITVIVPVTSVAVNTERDLYEARESFSYSVKIYPEDATDRSFSITANGATAVMDGSFITCDTSGDVTIRAVASNGVIGEKTVKIIDITEFSNAVRIEFYELVDRHRRDNGLRELAENEELQVYADIRAAELIVRFGHTRPDGSAAGSGWYDSQNYMDTRYAENAHWSSGHSYDLNPQTAALQIFTNWKESEGHNRHMLYDFNENITMALGLYFELGEYGTFTTGAIWASGY
ncbi:MAG: Ig-like domain-containing protein [Oscillospiraceae bacterium]|nr:Ig-like domain-containing protein [Oscillospiraceae bacterium]